VPAPSATDAAQHVAGRPAASDLTLAGIVAALGAAMAFTAAAARGFDVPALPAVVAIAEAVPLVWRRRAPVLVLAVTVGLFLVGVVLATAATTPFLGALVAAYTVGGRCRRRTAAVATAMVGVGTPLVTVGLLETSFPLTVSVTATPDHLLDALLGSVLGVAGAGLLGAYVGTRRAYVSELAERARRLAREREERAERAVIEERARIARELHDVAAHHLSGIALQASALARTVERDPAEARSLADSIRTESTTALAAMRRLVEVLRGGDAGGRSPQPTLDDLTQLVERARDDGLGVELVIEGPTEDLPRDVELAAFRVVQESLTNVRRHAPGADTHVHLVGGEERLRIEITDDGSDDGPPATNGDGHGLIGMRERVALLGGRLTAGPRDDADGWRLEADLPLTARTSR
jgi:signal transduction histidine kinase